MGTIFPSSHALQLPQSSHWLIWEFDITPMEIYLYCWHCEQWWLDFLLGAFFCHGNIDFGDGMWFRLTNRSHTWKITLVLFWFYLKSHLSNVPIVEPFHIWLPFLSEAWSRLRWLIPIPDTYSLTTFSFQTCTLTGIISSNFAWNWVDLQFKQCKHV